MTPNFSPFRPALSGPFASRFFSRVHLICEDITLDERNALIHTEIEWASNGTVINPKQRRIYRAIWLLLRDLIAVGWQYRWNNTLELAPPNDELPAKNQEDISDSKARVRKAMLSGKLDKIQEGRDFIERMERPSVKQSLVPIFHLIANSRELANDLRQVADIVSEEDRLAALKDAIQPYLQLVSENERCTESGHRLSDIWRYFRFTWATSAENTPGRTLLYLIRDRARAFHPVIGLASLENAPLRISARDNFLGWTFEAIKEELYGSLSPNRVFERLLTNIATALDEVKKDDLCTPDECSSPTDALIMRLASIVSKSTVERDEAVRAWRLRGEGDVSEEEYERSDLGDISTTAESLLYLRKRADRLGRLLSARRALQEILESSDFSTRWQSWIDTQVGQVAIGSAIIAQKNAHIGTSILELNVCGAIPPYNEILGGKLVALMMLSPEVIADYRARYGNRASDIASRMSGKPVVRPADLVYIGTTSLFRQGASQYTRLKLPQGLLNDNSDEIKWKELGETSGYGTWHITRQTLQAFEEVTGYLNANHVFGEGASIKMRTIRQALDVLFEPGQRELTNDITKHSMRRLVFGALLATNGKKYLGGESSKLSYYFHNDLEAKEGTEQIAQYWRKRWLFSRLRFDPAISRIAEFDASSLLVSKMLVQANEYSFTPIREASMPHDTEEVAWIDYVRDLYRGRSSYADSISDSLLKKIHVSTRLDQAIIDAAAKGKHVVLTGNPGDGKSHLLRILENRLNQLDVQPIIELDASSVADSFLKTNWEESVSTGRPYCLAINEAVLFNLADKYPDFQPLQEARQQAEASIVYFSEEPTTSSVVVFDLSRRNVLGSEVVKEAIANLISPRHLTRCGNCPNEGCDFIHNAGLLGAPLVQERLQTQFDRISRQGYHTTLRELQSFLSYLLFGGRDCKELIRRSGDHEFSFPNLPYKGDGRLFDFFRSTLDPARVTHPIWDEQLVNGDVNSQDWIPEWSSQSQSLDPLGRSQFEERKRAFYFAHTHGEMAFALADDDETAFAEFLLMSDREATRAILRKINRFFTVSDNLEELQIWQSHRYDHSPRRILYSSTKRVRQDFEIARPTLRATMQNGFDLAQDHVLLRLRSRKAASLKIDFSLFQLLKQTERGVPTLSLENPIVRRLWQFMEQLADVGLAPEYDEVMIHLLDPVSREVMQVEVDMTSRKFLSLKRGK